METFPTPERVWTNHWRVTQNSGSWYIHVPKEFASLKNMNVGDIVELTVWAVHKKAESERK